MTTNEGVERVPVQSSSIKSIGYDLQSSSSELECVNDGIYIYSNVIEHVHKEFLAAESKGRYFQAKIRGKYPFERSPSGSKADDRLLPKGQTTLLPSEA
jgi:hypothetical protein